MRKTITISVPEGMYEYIVSQRGHCSVSEYIRSLVAGDRRQRSDYAARPAPGPRRANDAFVFAEALRQVERLQAVLEGRDDR